MHHRKLSAGEAAGTYRITDTVTEAELFRGTIDSANAHPREVVKLGLACNAAAMILVHNHPSGDPEPNDTDQRITQQLKEALELMEIRALDHIVVGSEGCSSFAGLSHL